MYHKLYDVSIRCITDIQIYTMFYVDSFTAHRETDITYILLYYSFSGQLCLFLSKKTVVLFRWFLVVPSVVRTRLSWYHNNSLDMDTLVVLSEVLLLLSKIFSALTETGNRYYYFLSAPCGPWLLLIVDQIMPICSYLRFL